MKLEDLHRLHKETPNVQLMASAAGWISAMHIVLPKLIDVAIAAKEYGVQVSWKHTYDKESLGTLEVSIRALEALTNERPDRSQRSRNVRNLSDRK